MQNLVIGVDFGTDSVRAVLINASNGEEMASEVFWYPRWKAQKYCNATINQFRQHPLDHIEGLQKTVTAVLRQSGADPKSIVGIGIDTTGSSPLPLTQEGVPLAMTSGFEENPNAMVVLWKDHTAIKEASEINLLAKNWGGEDYTKFVGGVYSSEWFWAKILHISKIDQAVTNAAHTWMEHCDYMTFLLSDHKDLNTFKRSRCAAGHKAMWHESWGGLPDPRFLAQLDPYLETLRDRLYQHTYTSDRVAGHLDAEWAQKLGLTTKTLVAVGTFDAHAGAVGAQIDHHTLVRVMGTSTCDIIVSSNAALADQTVSGICGQVEGSVIPDMIGLEAGQSAFGDALAWFKEVLLWPIENVVLTSDTLTEEQKRSIRKESETKLLEKLADEAARIPLYEAVPTALDWVNGRRTPDANQELKSAFTGISLGTKAPHIFKALVNAICLGSKKIVDRFEEEGVTIDSVIGIGGVAKKSPFIMQTLANVLNRPIKIASSDQAPALGAAIYAATAAGIYTNVMEASKVMGSDFEAEYYPQPDEVEAYGKLVHLYQELGDFVERSTQKQTVHVEL